MSNQNTNQNIEQSRIQERTDFERFENVNFTIKYEEQHYSGKVLNLNSKGALLYCDNFHNLTLNKGDLLSSLEIKYENKCIGHIKNVKVCHVQSRENTITFGVFFVNSSTRNNISDIHSRLINTRKFFRAKPNPLNKILGHFKHPYLYDEKIYFETLDLSINGMKISTSLRNRTLLPGAKIQNITLQIPMTEPVSVDAEIIYTDIDSMPGKIIMGLIYFRRSSNFEKNISRYLLTFATRMPSEQIQIVRQAGLKPKHIKDTIQYTYISSIDEYNKVLELRAKAYKSNGKIPDETLASEMADFYDTNSIIIIARLHNEIIGSVRLTQCERNEDKYELDESIVIPDKINRLKTIEISRLSVDPAFHNTDTVFGLLERCTQLVLQKNFTHVITSCIDDMLEYYSKLGFKQIGPQFELKTLKGIPHYFLTLDIRTVRTSFRLNPIYWFYTYSRVVRHMTDLSKKYSERIGFINKMIIFVNLNSMRLKNWIKSKRR